MELISTAWRQSILFLPDHTSYLEWQVQTTCEDVKVILSVEVQDYRCNYFPIALWLLPGLVNGFMQGSLG